MNLREKNLVKDAWFFGDISRVKNTPALKVSDAVLASESDESGRPPLDISKWRQQRRVGTNIALM